MEIVGLTVADFEHIVYVVSRAQYHGNLVMVDGRRAGGVRRPKIRARVTVTDSRGPGARTSWSGRHGPWASWEAYRDVLSELFYRFPDAIVRTSVATYKGSDGFEKTFPRTALRNVGSMVQPVTMPELSVWPDPGRWRPPSETDGRTATPATETPEPEDSGYVYWSGGSGDAARIFISDSREPYPVGPDIISRIDRTIAAATSD